MPFCMGSLGRYGLYNGCLPGLLFYAARGLFPILAIAHTLWRTTAGRILSALLLSSRVVSRKYLFLFCASTALLSALRRFRTIAGKKSAVLSLILSLRPIFLCRLY